MPGTLRERERAGRAAKVLMEKEGLNFYLSPIYYSSSQTNVDTAAGKVDHDPLKEHKSLCKGSASMINMRAIFASAIYWLAFFYFLSLVGI